MTVQNPVVDHAALTLNLDFASAGHTDFLSTNTAQTITAQKIIDATTALRFGDGSGPTLGAAAATTILNLVGDLDISRHLALGVNAAPVDASAFIVDEDFTIAGVGVNSVVRRATGGTIGTLRSIIAQMVFEGTGAITRSSMVELTSPLGAGTKPTTHAGLRIENQGLSGMADSFGLRIMPQSGSTNPRAMGIEEGESYHAGNFRFGSTTSPTEVVDVIGNVKSSSQFLADGLAAAPGYSYPSNTDAGIFSSVGGATGISIAGTEIFRFTVFSSSLIQTPDFGMLLQPLRVTNGAGNDFDGKGGNGVGGTNPGGDALLTAGLAAGGGTDGSAVMRDASATAVVEVDSTGIGFQGATPIVVPTGYTQTYSAVTRTHSNPTGVSITDNSGGTASQTIAAITGGAASCQTATVNAVASLVDEVNKLVSDLANVKRLINSVIDDGQSYGLLQ